MTFTSRNRTWTWTWCALVMLSALLGGAAMSAERPSPRSSVTSVASSSDLRGPDQHMAVYLSTRDLFLTDLARHEFLVGAAEHEWAAAVGEALARRYDELARRPSTPKMYAITGSGDCANPIIPESVARAESGCTWDAYNPTGCGGRGCTGFYQLDRGHFSAVSPWNSNVSGSCYGLDANTREGQTECASRLGPNAWG